MINITRGKWQIGTSGISIPVPPISGIVGFPPITTVNDLIPVTYFNKTKPPYLVEVIDNSLGYNIGITRVTDSTAFGVTSPYLLDPGYSKDQNWNADMSYLKIGRRNLLNGTTYARIRSMSTPSGPTIWCPVNPLKLYVFGSSAIQIFNPTTNAITGTAVNLTSIGADTTAVTLGNAEGTISKNGKYCIAQMVKGGEYIWIICDLELGTIVSTRTDTQLGSSHDWITISQSGNYIVAARTVSIGGAGTFKRIYDFNWNIIQSDVGQLDHRDPAYDVLGNEVLTGMNPPSYNRMDNGSRITLISQARMSEIWGASAGHSSARMLDFPGWALFSHTSLATPTAREMFYVELTATANPRVIRFGSSRSSVSNYDREPQATASPDGKRVIFGSDWAGAGATGGTGDVDSYVLEFREPA